MKRIWSFLQPANSELSRPFRQFQVIKISSACPHLELIETSNIVHGLNIRWCGRSYAASASSDTVEAKKSRRRVSKDERKSMVENYVNKYRKMNAGKFPTVSDAQKDVGGSYYVVREILQELKYNSNIPLVESKDAVSLEKSSARKDEICADFRKVSQTKELGERLSSISKVNIGDDGSKSFESKEESQSSISVQGDKEKDAGPQSHCPVNDYKSSLHYDPENNIKKETVHEDELKLNGLQPKSEPQESIGLEISGREINKVLTEDAGPQKKSTMWQNLRSFANGILGLWKRS